MIRFLFYIPIVVSLSVLGAHFLRSGNWVGVAVPLLSIALLFVKRTWTARLVQLVLLAGAAEWAHTLYTLVQIRAAHGQPFTRVVVILGVVIVVTLLSALLFQAKTLKGAYEPGTINWPDGP